MNISKEKPCLICGVPTTCLHYDVISCRGCKQFFRRSYTSSKTYACKSKTECKLTKGAKCKACRYKKCLAVGMNPEAIVSSEPLAIQKISENDEFHLIPELLVLENRLKELRLSEYQPCLSKSVGTYELVKHPTNLGRIEMNPIYFSSNDDENAKNHAFRKMAKHKHDRKFWPLVDLILCIEMAKTLPIFEEMDINDKVELLKNVAYINVLLTEAFYSYLELQSTLWNPDGSLPVLSKCKHGAPTTLAEKAFTRLLDPFYRINLTHEEYVLIKMLLYCYYPYVSNLSTEAKTKLQKEYHKVSKLLLKHMQIQYGTDEGAKKYRVAKKLKL